MKTKIYVLSVIMAFLATTFMALAQDTVRYRGPIIDMHLHTITESWDKDHVPVNPVTDLPSTATTGDELLRQTILEMDKHKVVIGFLSGYLDSVLS